MTAIEVLSPGMLSTIQDLGRYGYQKYGVSVSGAMDKFALRVGNLLVGNKEGAAAIEMSVLGPKLKLHSDLTVAFTGGDFCPKVNGNTVPMWQPLILRDHDIISFSHKSPESGFRAYMAVSAGIDVPLVLGSRSTHLLSMLGGLGRPLVKGDSLPVFRSATKPASRGLRADQIPKYKNNWEIRVILGPQDDYFTDAGLETFFSETYQITPEANRMGYRLKGPRIEHRKGADILTDATPPGSIQVPGDGMPIILLADCQTTGGYSKIGGVISPDQDKLAQAAIGDRLCFQKVDIAQAYSEIDAAEKKIQEIKSYIAFDL